MERLALLFLPVCNIWKCRQVNRHWKREAEIAFAQSFRGTRLRLEGENNKEETNHCDLICKKVDGIHMTFDFRPLCKEASLEFGYMEVVQIRHSPPFAYGAYFKEFICPYEGDFISRDREEKFFHRIEDVETKEATMRRKITNSEASEEEEEENESNKRWRLIPEKLVVSASWILRRLVGKFRYKGWSFPVEAARVHRFRSELSPTLRDSYQEWLENIDYQVWWTRLQSVEIQVARFQTTQILQATVPPQARHYWIEEAVKSYRRTGSTEHLNHLKELCKRAKKLEETFGSRMAEVLGDKWQGCMANSHCSLPWPLSGTIPSYLFCQKGKYPTWESVAKPLEQLLKLAAELGIVEAEQQMRRKYFF